MTVYTVNRPLMPFSFTTFVVPKTNWNFWTHSTMKWPPLLNHDDRFITMNAQDIVPWTCHCDKAIYLTRLNYFLSGYNNMTKHDWLVENVPTSDENIP